MFGKETFCPVYIGTAGWSISKENSSVFPLEGSHLERYSKVLNAVEVNSSFYRHHQEKTYARWNDSVPAPFRFSVKLSQEVTHFSRLNVRKEMLQEILNPFLSMGKLGALLVQLPPSLEFDMELVSRFFDDLRSIYSGHVAVEPRHVSWQNDKALRIFQDFCLTKVRADPELVSDRNRLFEKNNPFQYFRLHGSPELYKSNYPDSFLEDLKKNFDNRETWVIFDNTMEGHALKNAVSLSSYLSEAI